LLRSGGFFFGVIQALYVFFSSSSKRWQVLLQFVPNLTLKPLSETRWESRIDAIKPLRYQLGNVYEFYSIWPTMKL
jgi:hypothetical protein